MSIKADDNLLVLTALRERTKRNRAVECYGHFDVLKSVVVIWAAQVNEATVICSTIPLYANVIADPD